MTANSNLQKFTYPTLLSALLRNANASRFTCFPDCPVGLARGSQITLFVIKEPGMGPVPLLWERGDGFLMHNADERYPCHAGGCEKRAVRQGSSNIWKPHTLCLLDISLDIYSGINFQHWINVLLLKSQTVPTIPIDTHLHGGFNQAVHCEWKLCLSIFEAMTWVRLTLFLQGNNLWR